MRALIVILCTVLFSFNSLAQDTNKVDDAQLKQGLWITSYPGGKVESQGFYQDNKREGAWKFYHPDGQLNKIEEYENGSTPVVA